MYFSRPVLDLCEGMRQSRKYAKCTQEAQSTRPLLVITIKWALGQRCTTSAFLAQPGRILQCIPPLFVPCHWHRYLDHCWPGQQSLTSASGYRLGHSRKKNDIYCSYRFYYCNNSISVTVVPLLLRFFILSVVQQVFVGNSCQKKTEAHH